MNDIKVGVNGNESISQMAREEWLGILDGGQRCHMEKIDGNDGQNYEHPLWKDVYAVCSVQIGKCPILCISHFSV